MSIQLTVRQQRVFDLIKTILSETGMPPTRAEIAARLGFRSANAAEEHLRALARKGVIELRPGASRGIRLLVDNRVRFSVPVVGRVAAGQPILASEHIEDYCQFDPGVFKPRASYLLRVSGMSMRGAGILDGDLLAVHATPEARNGQIVVARLDDEVTVKRFRRRGGRIYLEPENPDFAPLEVDPRQHLFVIEGLAVGVLRTHV